MDGDELPARPRAGARTTGIPHSDRGRRPRKLAALERLLQNAGFAVLVAEDGAQAVERFREWRPEFIWMDLHLPVMDGVGSNAPHPGL